MSNNMTSLMAAEAAETADRIAEQLDKNLPAVQRVVDLIRLKRPELVYMVGRGSSDHAGVFAKYLIEIELGIPVTAAAPSIASVYHRQLKLEKALVLVLSQSGRSPDILAQVAMAKASGAMVIAIVNDAESPLAQTADVTLPILAGEERAVAATKSYLATLSVLLQLVACWSGNQELQEGLKRLPALLRDAQALPAQLTADSLRQISHCVVLGRGLGYAIAREIALKLKEVCGIQAEAFSSAEFIHGPVTLVQPGFALISVDIADESQAVHLTQVADIESRGGLIQVLHVGGLTAHPRLLPLLVLQRFYLDIEVVARSLGVNPDAPPGLNKVTQTV